VRTGKSNGLVKLTLAGVRDTVSSDERGPFPDQVASDQGKGQGPRQLRELWRRLRDLIDKKKMKPKTRAKNIKRSKK
jgi:hypothetical protein